MINRARIVKRHKLIPNEREKIISEVTALSYIVPGTTQIKVVRDPDDDKIISAAIEGEAEYIVTRDRDLLDLKQYQGIKMVTPEAFMGILRIEK